MEERRSLPTDQRTLVYLELAPGSAPADPRAWDDLLADVVRRLRVQLRRNDAVGRYGSGILALLSGVRSELGERVAHRMLESLDHEVQSAVEEVEPGEGLDDAAARAQSELAAPSP